MTARRRRVKKILDLIACWHGDSLTRTRVA